MKYRKVVVTLELYTAAPLEQLNDQHEWARVFAWAKPGDAHTPKEKFEVLSVKAEGEKEKGSCSLDEAERRYREMVEVDNG